MGQRMSCGGGSSGGRVDDDTAGLLRAVQRGEWETAKSILQKKDDIVVIELSSHRDGLSPLHLCASAGQIEILSMLLDHGANPDMLNRHKQTPLMLAAMHGKISCVETLIQAGANMLMFDSISRRTCLHYAALHGHSDCLQTILSSAHSSPVAASWGFARFVNIRDGNGATPLHLAAREGKSECVHILLDKGALVCASTGGYGYSGSLPLHWAARGGSLDCVRELLAWGADRHQRDSSGRSPYMVALKYKHTSCAALLNPLSAEPLVWPSALKFITELSPEAKSLLEKALIDANKKREKSILKETVHYLSPPLNSNLGNELCESDDSEVELCCICFEQSCTIQVEECGHQMCAHCTLALCCQNNKKANHPENQPHSFLSPSKAPLCPFCRSTITQLAVATTNNGENNDSNCCSDDIDDIDGGDVVDDVEVEMSPSKPRRSKKYWSCNEVGGSSSFKGLSAMGSIGKMVVGLSSGKVAAECSGEMQKAEY